MAVLLRCSSLLPRPRRYIPGKTPVSGEAGSLLFKLKKQLLLPCATNSSRPYSSKEAGGKHFNVLQDDVETPYLIGCVHKYDDTLLQRVSPHQTRSSPLPLIITNALMLCTPLQVFAETCETDRPVFEMPLLLFVALVGATVGGLLARQRKGELRRVNEQLRQINAALRRQAKIESYAPALSYAPVGAKIPENEVIIDPRKHELISHLKNGKNFLRNQDPEKAFVEFKTALELAQNLKDPIEEKKAARGLGASLQRQGKYREAIIYHSMVLTISDREKEDSGNTEAYGAIADCYTELGDLERAGVYYDQYIARLETD
ncbi:hypothetical protein DCAR_0518448 [Daucus carota subsp. sativus]|uniref:Protein FLUORESCENT IN BLUE LIGHT, chloroplastic n=1 Tax=Daucus carota subsp. sativus TaxID=79200 RepID=A0AAF0X3L0_DAUCS|nr:hypothetical protein DCAR_0518448 [Daucus carota subsp. sativus]